MSHKLLHCLAAVGLATTATVAPAIATVEVGSLAASRVGTNWTLDASNLEDLRSKLLDPANFGAAGTFSEDIAITDVSDPLTTTLLANFDVFFIGYLNDASAGALTATELARLDEWVRDGGTLIATCDTASYDAACEFFGYPQFGGASGEYRPTTAGLEQTPFNGPFGIVSRLGVSGSVGTFGDTTGTAVLARDSEGANRGAILLKSLGRGRIVFISDVDTLSDGRLSPGTGIVTDNDRFAANLFAFAGSFCGGPVLCLGADQRFAVTVDWQTTTRTGVGTGTALASDTGSFWFFRGENTELIVKVLNACSVNNHYWVFAGGLTNVQVEITVTDRDNGTSRVYNNLQSTPFQPVQDTTAFATCP